MVRKVFSTLGLLVASAALAGCNSTVHTSVQVTSATASTLSVGVDFSGQIGQKLASDPALRHQLEQVISQRLHQDVTLSVKGEEVSWSQSVTYEQVTSNGDITGLSSAVLSPSGGNRAIIDMTLVAPSAISAAIAKGVAGQPHAADLERTMSTYTFITQSVTFPGTIIQASSSGPKVTVAGDTASVTQRLGSYQPGTVTVTGSLTGQSLLSTQDLLLGGGVLAGAVVGLVLWRRRS